MPVRICHRATSRCARQEQAGSFASHLHGNLHTPPQPCLLAIFKLKCHYRSCEACYFLISFSLLLYAHPPLYPRHSSLSWEKETALTFGSVADSLATSLSGPRLGHCAQTQGCDHPSSSHSGADTNSAPLCPPHKASASPSSTPLPELCPFPAETVSVSERGCPTC